MNHTQDLLARAADLTTFQRACLLILANEGGMNGQEVRNHVSAYAGEDIPNPRVYTNLDALDENGLVQKRRHEPDNRTNTYEITHQGREVIQADYGWVEQQVTATAADGGDA